MTATVVNALSKSSTVLEAICLKVDRYDDILLVY